MLPGMMPVLVGGALPLEWSVEGNAFNTSNITNYSFGSMAFGAAAADRYLIALVHKFTVNNGNPVTSVTIGGVGATKLTSRFQWNSDQGVEASIWIALVPSGTSGTVAVNSGDSNSNCGVQLVRALGIDPAGYATTQTGVNSTTVSVSLDAPSQGVIVAVGAYGRSGIALRAGSTASRAYDYGATGQTVSITTPTITGGDSTWVGVDLHTENKENQSSRNEIALCAASFGR